ncbi:MAG: FixH family protein [Alphaproteobacteria bacterium]|nr:FixH family protein [Alphaproteobacteria bacterium]
MSAQSPNMSQDGWTLKGWHVLAALLAFFGTMIAANGVFLYYAITTFTGVETSDAYRKGVAYNARLEESRQLGKLGWQGKFKVNDGVIELVLVGEDGTPVRGVRIDGKVGRPATDRYDAQAKFSEIGDGIYRSDKLTLAPGNWIVTVEARDPVSKDASPRFRLKERLWLSQ